MAEITISDILWGLALTALIAFIISLFMEDGEDELDGINIVVPRKSKDSSRED